MFRDFAQRKAKAYDLFGFVKNNTDWGVAVVAEGEEENLKKFIEFLKKGSLFSKVEKVETIWKDATGEFKKFNIE